MEQRRPKELAYVNEPPPLEDELERFPRPLGPSGFVKGEDPTSFRTHADDQHAPGEKPQFVAVNAKETEDSWPPLVGGVSGKRSERAWRRRNIVGGTQHDWEHIYRTKKVGKQFADELGETMFFHFLQDARFQNQNDKLTRELQRMKDEKNQISKLCLSKAPTRQNTESQSACHYT